MEDFGSKLQAKIKAIGSNSRQIATTSGLDYPLVNKIVNSKAVPSVNSLIKLATVPQLKDIVLPELAKRALSEYGIEAIEFAFQEAFKDDPAKLEGMNAKIAKKVEHKKGNKG